MTRSSFLVKKYRSIAEKKIGRKLNPNEDVHHIDGNPKNNDPENLMVLSHSEHTSLHHLLKGEYLFETNCFTCKKLIKKPTKYLTPNRKFFCGINCFKKEQRKNVPSKERLSLLLIENRWNRSKVGRQFGVSCNAVKKWVKKYEL